MATFFANVFGNIVGDAISGAFGMELTVRSWEMLVFFSTELKKKTDTWMLGTLYGFVCSVVVVVVAVLFLTRIAS